MSGAPSRYFVDAVERSEILLINPQSHQEVIQHVPGYGASMRAGLQRHNAAKDKRIATSLSASAEERYLEFMKTYPSIAQRLPGALRASCRDNGSCRRSGSH